MWRRYNGYMLCFAEMTMTAENRFSGKTVMTLLRQFHKFQLSREIIASLYCLLISYKVPITESHLFIFLSDPYRSDLEDPFLLVLLVMLGPTSRNRPIIHFRCSADPHNHTYSESL